MAKTIYILVLGIVIGLLAAGLVLLIASPARNNPILILPTGTPANLYVHVAGMVNNPGIVILPPGSRVEQAIQAAGGMSADAETNALNLAARLTDGQKIYVPRIGETMITQTNPGNSSNPTEKLDINLATQEQLERLPGIGPSKAADILAYRQNQGRFVTIEDIQNVPGIGPAMFEKIRDLIFVSELPK